jgi:hypothetical protein
VVVWQFVSKFEKKTFMSNLKIQFFYFKIFLVT